MPLDILNFVRKWQQSSLTERSAYQQHFRDLCEALNVPHPAEQDTDGSSYTFEKHVPKTGTDDKGFADVWKRGWFAWEYKSKGGDLRPHTSRSISTTKHSRILRSLWSATSIASKSTPNSKNLPSRVYAFTRRPASPRAGNHAVPLSPLGRRELTDTEILERLLALNHERAASQ